MNLNELKVWFFNDSPSLVKLWSELEISVQGTSEFKDFITENSISSNKEWLKIEGTEVLARSANQNYLETKCDLIEYGNDNSPKDFDGGVWSSLGTPWRRRFVFFNDDWYTVCDENGVITLDYVLELRYPIDFNSIKAKDLIKTGWRMKGV